MPRYPNEIERHRITDNWTVRFEDKLYQVERSYSRSYPEHRWEVTAIRNGPNGGQYTQVLVDGSKTAKHVVEWLKQEIEK